MSKLKVCFIGFGSIAKRHILNLIQICREMEIEVVVDLCRSSNSGEVDSEYKGMIYSVYYGVDNIPDDYDIVFVTNPTKCHFDTLVKVQGKAKHFFIEKPVFDSSNVDFSKLIFPCGGICYVACPLRYTNVIQYLKKNVDFNEIYSVRSISSSYLPDWRAGIDYRKTYSAHKTLGGGVAIDLIHEWDYITYLMGIPEKVYSIIGRFSDLEIDSEDLAIYIAQYKDKCVELHLDYFGRKTMRKIELYGKEDTIIGDLISNEVMFLNEGKKILLSEERNDFQKRELQAFLRMVCGNETNCNDIKNACKILELANGEYI